MSNRHRAANPFSEIRPVRKGMAKFPMLKLLRLNRYKSRSAAGSLREAAAPAAISAVQVTSPMRKHHRNDVCSSRSFRAFTATAGMETFRITVFRKSASCTLKIPAFLNPYPISSSDRYTSVCVITLFISFLYPVFPSALKGRASA